MSGDLRTRECPWCGSARRDIRPVRRDLGVRCNNSFHAPNADPDAPQAGIADAVDEATAGTNYPTTMGYAILDADPDTPTACETCGDAGWFTADPSDPEFCECEAGKRLMAANNADPATPTADAPADADLRGQLSLTVRAAARAYLHRDDGDYWDSGIADAAADALLPLVRAQMAEAWEQGRSAERRDWEFTFDLSTPDEDRQPLPNPYRAALSGGDAT